MRAARQLAWCRSHGLRRDEPVLPRRTGGPRGQFGYGIAVTAPGRGECSQASMSGGAIPATRAW